MCAGGGTFLGSKIFAVSGVYGQDKTRATRARNKGYQYLYVVGLVEEAVRSPLLKGETKVFFSL